MPVTPKEVRACGAAETIRRRSRPAASSWGHEPRVVGCHRLSNHTGHAERRGYHEVPRARGRALRRDGAERDEARNGGLGTTSSLPIASILGSASV
jgi:hypothetical protein